MRRVTLSDVRVGRDHLVGVCGQLGSHLLARLPHAVLQAVDQFVRGERPNLAVLREVASFNFGVCWVREGAQRLLLAVHPVSNEIGVPVLLDPSATQPPRRQRVGGVCIGAGQVSVE